MESKCQMLVRILFNFGDRISTKLVVLHVHVVKNCTPVNLNHALVRLNKERKHARIWDTNSLAKTTVNCLEKIGQRASA